MKTFDIFWKSKYVIRKAPVINQTNRWDANIGLQSQEQHDVVLPKHLITAEQKWAIPKSALQVKSLRIVTFFFFSWKL